jgi:hypothetical protein
MLIADGVALDPVPVENSDRRVSADIRVSFAP